LLTDGDVKLNLGTNDVGLYSRVTSSSWLSGGAIAGIVIGPVVALISISISIMMLKKPNVNAPFQENTLGVNTNNLSQ